MNKHLRIVALGAVVGLTATSCGKLVEIATDKVVEEGIEQAIEADTGEDVELDLDLDDGKITITGEDGEEIKIDADEEDGKISITGTDGEGEDFDVDITGDDEDGVTIESEDGSIYSGSDLPDDWPSEWAFPSGITVVQAGRFAEGDSITFQATFTGSDVESIKDHYAGINVGQDITAESVTTSDGTTSAYLAWGDDSTQTSFMSATDDGTEVLGSIFITVEDGG